MRKSFNETQADEVKAAIARLQALVPYLDQPLNQGDRVMLMSALNAASRMALVAGTALYEYEKRGIDRAATRRIA